MEDYTASISKGFSIALKALVPYEYEELKAVYGSNWWSYGVYPLIRDDFKRDYPEKGTDEELLSKIDMALALRIMDQNWQDIFRRKLSKETRSWVKETAVYRNKDAHKSVDGGLTQIETTRCLETLALICAQIDNDAEAELQKLVRIVRYGSAEGSAGKKVVLKVVPKTNGPKDLPSWRSIIAPHPDVAEGRYRNAEFAADLSQVARGLASFEYLDPVEFFSRTYVTEGLKNLLVQALQRVTGKGGEPVIELKTAFGGGKTHSMLALYHMLGGRITIDRVPHLKSVLEASGLSSFPIAHIAVIVGTALAPASFRRPADMPGIQINTVWGEIAYQLAKSVGKPNLYDIIKESDRKGVNPGSETLAKLFKAVGPCLLLMDELVAYGRTLYGRKDLPAGTYENFLTFIQSLTEAACECPNCLLVASIPESDNEIGGEVGQAVLEQLTHYFARKEAVWKPVASNEGFEVVRRRLFQTCTLPEKRDEVCEAYFKMYRSDKDRFPAECGDEAYLKRMKDCYPIHPEVFDRLYDDWATLEKFQKTRGVLRLMAAVINDLWSNGDSNPMIMPASIPIGTQVVKEELLRYLPGNTWEPIVDTEIDGKKSIPASLDSSPNYNVMSAARRVSRSLFFGSAPSEGMTRNRGLTKPQLALACGQPGDSMFKYDDALKDLLDRLSFLYSTPTNDRFWYDTRPTLRKMMEEKAGRVERDQALDEIKAVLRNTNSYASFAGVHICPATSLDIVDTMEARLVIVDPRITYDRSDSSVQDRALAYMQDVLASKGSGPRLYKNMLIFSMADNRKLGDSVDEAKKLIAWKQIYAERDTKGLNASDIKTVEEGVKNSERTLKARILQTYCWMFSPAINPENSLKDIVLSPREISVSDSITASVEREAKQNEFLITKYAPITLRMAMDSYIWKDRDYFQIKDLWKCFCSYCYLPRLTSQRVFDDAVVDGLRGKDYFALADGFLDDKYVNLRFDSFGLKDSDILVKPDVARVEIAREEMKAAEEENYPEGTSDNPGTPYGPTTTPPEQPAGPFGGQTAVSPTTQDTSFYLTTKVDPSRATRDVGRIVDEVITYLQSIRDARVDISLEVHADFRPGALTSDKKRTVEENCRTLHITDCGFDKD